MTTIDATIDEQKLEALVNQAVGDFGAVLHTALAVVGDRLGLYRALADGDPMSSSELAERTGTVERNVREWLAAEAAGGYVTLTDDGRFTLSPEQAVALTDESSPAFILGGFQLTLAAAKADEQLTAAMRDGGGFGWHEHHHDLFEGTERFFRPGYRGNLVDSWLPALDGVVEVLQTGGSVADVGCGHGASTVLMAEAFPRSWFTGFDYHAASIEAAERAAEAAGVGVRTTFEVASAKDFGGRDYDLICYFDCLHDMGDPVGALRHACEALAPDGRVLLVEPFAGDSLADNLNPVGRVFYAASSLVCTPASQSQEVGRALGAQAGEAQLRAVATEAGFSHVRRATETPFNLILELRP